MRTKGEKECVRANEPEENIIRAWNFVKAYDTNNN